VFGPVHYHWAFFLYLVKTSSYLFFLDCISSTCIGWTYDPCRLGRLLCWGSLPFVESITYWV